jgi:hypothetical protein
MPHLLFTKTTIYFPYLLRKGVYYSHKAIKRHLPDWILSVFSGNSTFNSLYFIFK